MRILHLEDDKHDAELVQRALVSQGVEFDIQVVASAAEYLAALETSSFSVILSDTGVPGFEGPTALEIARGKVPDVPFFVVSGHLDNEEAVRRFKMAGARDCISKTNLSILGNAVHAALAEMNGQTQHRDTVSRYTQGMERLITVVQELSLARDLESVMAIVRRAARALTGADGATFVLRDGDKCYYADEDAIAPLWKGSRFPMSTCISGWAMLHRKPALIDDIYADARIPHDAYRPTFVKSLAMVPIRTLEPIGAIGNYWATPHAPTAEEMKLLQALANTTAVAMENIQVYAELEQRVKDRTTGLALANKELEAFSYAVSHDLRAPLRHINGYMQMLEEDCADGLNELGRGYMHNIRHSTKRMGQLIEDLLQLSRTTQTPVKREAIDLSDMARDIAAGLLATAPRRQVEFVIADRMPVQGDPRLLRIALENLMSNAWKYSSKNASARIEVRQVSTPEAPNAYCVCDDGAGFDMAYAGKLFGTFQRLHADSDFPGTGIGLATVQRIIHKHGGRTWAEAAVGQGASFYFSLD